MSIPNHDHEIEKKYHPENFEPGKTVYNPLIRPIKVRLLAKKDSTKKSILRFLTFAQRWKIYKK